MSRQGSPLIRRAAGDGPLIKTNSLELVFSSINECLLKLTTRVDSVEQVQKSCWRSSEPALCPDPDSLEEFAMVPESILAPVRAATPGSNAEPRPQLLPPKSIPAHEFKSKVVNG